MNCIIDGWKHRFDALGKCILCDKQFCCVSKHHGLAACEVVSENGSTIDFVCPECLKRYKKRGWKVKKWI